MKVDPDQDLTMGRVDRLPGPGSVSCSRHAAHKDERAGLAISEKCGAAALLAPYDTCLAMGFVIDLQIIPRCFSGKHAAGHPHVDQVAKCIVGGVI